MAIGKKWSPKPPTRGRQSLNGGAPVTGSCSNGGNFYDGRIESTGLCQPASGGYQRIAQECFSALSTLKKAFNRGARMCQITKEKGKT